MLYDIGLTLAAHGRCTLCQINPIDGGFLCTNCDSERDWQMPPVPMQCLLGNKTNKAKANQASRANQEKWLTIYAAGNYDGVLKLAMQAFKDRQQMDVLPFLLHALWRLSERLGDVLAKEVAKGDVVLAPIPTTPKRLIERGFYPAGLLAEYLAKLLGVPYVELLARPQEAVHQRGLSRSARQLNVMGAFTLADGVYLADGATVIVFDDVSTTGATLKMAATALWQVNVRWQVVGAVTAQTRLS